MEITVAFTIQLTKETTQIKKIVEYLNNGSIYAAAAGLVKDVISGEVIGTKVMLTDGVWIWCNDLSTYVEKYDIALPQDFIDTVNDKIS